MRPVSQSERHDAPGRSDQLVPGVGTVIDDVVKAAERPVREPIVAYELPDVFLRVQLGALGRQSHDGDVRGHGEPFGDMPPGLIRQEQSMWPGATLAVNSSRNSSNAALSRRSDSARLDAVCEVKG